MHGIAAHGSTMISSEPDAALARVGSYELIQPLADGGMSRVYLGRHCRRGDLVAVKILRREAASREVFESQRSRFFNEARAISAIQHSNVVTLESYGETETGDVYLVMEYVEGHTLRKQLEEKRRLTLEQILHIAEQIGDAVSVAHGHGIVHRDLKPNNVMLVPGRAGERLTAKVVDFGIAKFLQPDEEDDSPVTRTGLVLGTPKYMSPEQCRSERTIDHRSDIYSLGVILYRMVAGRCPFEGSGPGDIIGKHLHVPAAPPRTFAPDIPDELDALIMRCMEKQPDDRFATMDEVIRALRRLSADRDASEAGVTTPLRRDERVASSRSVQDPGQAGDGISRLTLGSDEHVLEHGFRDSGSVEVIESRNTTDKHMAAELDQTRTLLQVTPRTRRRLSVVGIALVLVAAVVGAAAALVSERVDEVVELVIPRDARSSDRAERPSSSKIVPSVRSATTSASGAGDSDAVASPAAVSPAAESPVAESPAAESPAAESPVAESPAAESPVASETARPGVAQSATDRTRPVKKASKRTRRKKPAAKKRPSSDRRAAKKATESGPRDFEKLVY